MVNTIWRQKTLMVTIILCMLMTLVSVLYVMRPLETHDAFMDDVPPKLYAEVLEQWYTFPKGANGMSDRNLFDDYLVKEVRDKWNIWRHDASKPYDLTTPQVNDPSMGQSQRIRKILENKKNGFFIECGAFDGETRSNTLYFERFLNWTGILIEADPINFTKMLKKNRKAYLSPTCLSTKKHPMLASFLMANNIGRLHDPTNSAHKQEEYSSEMENNADVAHNGRHVTVQCFPLATYIAALGVKRIDYFSLDIEGNEIEVLETIPFDSVDITILSVEYIHNEKSRDYMIAMMNQRGYVVDSFVNHPDNLANDVIFLKKDAGLHLPRRIPEVEEELNLD